MCCVLISTFKRSPGAKASNTLGFSGPLWVQLLVPLLLQVGTKAVAMDTKVTLAATTGHAVDK